MDSAMYNLKCRSNVAMIMAIIYIEDTRLPSVFANACK